MGIIDLLALGIGFSMDAFAMSVCKGLSAKKAGIKTMLTCGIWFGLFQAIMPLIGFYLGSLFAQAIETLDHWIAFALLALIGANMLKEAFSPEEECDCEKNADLTFKTMFALSIATSVDALAGGISLAMEGNVNIWIAIAFIGSTTFLMSGIGVKIGSVFGRRFERKAQIVGGVILILLGIKILLEHLGVLL